MQCGEEQMVSVPVRRKRSVSVMYLVCQGRNDVRNSLQFVMLKSKVKGCATQVRVVFMHWHSLNRDTLNKDEHYED